MVVVIHTVTVMLSFCCIVVNRFVQRTRSTWLLKSRHLAKAFTWRIIASVTTVLIALTFGLPPKAVGAVFFVDLVIKFVLYYGHERVWYRYIKFGRKNENL